MVASLHKSSLSAYNVLTIFVLETFKRVAHLVSGVRLQDHIVNLVFKMFDENGKQHEITLSIITVQYDYHNPISV